MELFNKIYGADLKPDFYQNVMNERCKGNQENEEEFKRKRPIAFAYVFESERIKLKKLVDNDRMWLDRPYLRVREMASVCNNMLNFTLTLLKN